MRNILVVFGASGDLTSRKLIPALFQLFVANSLPEPFFVVGVSRTPATDQEWRDKLKITTERFAATKFSDERWRRFATKIFYFPGDVQSPATFPELERFLSRLKPPTDSSQPTGSSEGKSESLKSPNGSYLNERLPNSSEIAADSTTTAETSGTNCVYYLSIAPKFYAETIENLGEAGMTAESTEPNRPIELRKIIIEKPFGTSWATARELNRLAHQSFREDQIYRIDHYLGKETVNNIFALRFANAVFEPLWNRNYIDHIQITANESVTVGRRGAFYETAGVFRDMFQNHLLQLLTITTMEPPNRFDAKSIRDEKVKILRAVRPTSPEYIRANSIRGQYETYRNEPGVDPESNVPTFAAVKLYIDNWRWKDVPFYLRSGKGASCQTTQIVVQYKEPPHSIFRPSRRESEEPRFAANRLLIQIQPSEGIKLSFLSKVPGSEMELRNSELTFSFDDHYSEELPEAYQRLLLDAFSGDASLFARNDEVEAAWEIIDPIAEYWDKTASEPDAVRRYSIGSWGPDASEDWMRAQGKEWFNLCPILKTPRPR